MALTLAEGLVDAVIAYVEANLAAKLTALNAEYADAITLENTVATYKGIKSLETIPNYPVFYAISPSQRLAPRAVSGGATVTSKPELLLGVLALDQDPETLQVRLYRYARALIELMLEAMAAGDQLASWNLATDQEWEVDTDRGPLQTEAGDSLVVGEVIVAMRANKIETK